VGTERIWSYAADGAWSGSMRRCSWKTTRVKAAAS
jgi:hypothetical protein